MKEPSKALPRNYFALDPAWSLFANLAIGFSIFAFVYLSAGTESLFQVPSSKQEDWIDVNRAYFSALISGLLLLALASIALRAQSTVEPCLHRRLPRLRLLEGDDGPRDKFVAISGFTTTIVLPVAAFFSALNTYIQKSRIATYDDLASMGEGFLSSRWKALFEYCESQPCYRFYPSPESNQWFWFSDVGLVLVFFGALFAWVVFFVRFWRGQRH